MRFNRILVATLIVLIGLLVRQSFTIIWQQEDIRLLEQARKIDADQIRDILFAAQQAQTMIEGEKTRAYMAGFTQAQTKPDLTQLWHSGYDRGMQTQTELLQAAAKAGETASTD